MEEETTGGTCTSCGAAGVSTNEDGKCENCAGGGHDMGGDAGTGTEETGGDTGSEDTPAV